jgi:hypothetical protein
MVSTGEENLIRLGSPKKKCIINLFIISFYPDWPDINGWPRNNAEIIKKGRFLTYIILIIVTVIAARPKFVKATVVHRTVLLNPAIDEDFVPTGQHLRAEI